MIDDADRQPAHRALAQRAGFCPAPEEEQGIGDVPGQEVAVNRFQTGAPSVLDPFVGDLDRLGPAADEVEHGGQVGSDPEEGIGIVELARHALGFAEQLDRFRRVLAPGEGHRERRRGVHLLGPRDGIARTGHLDRVSGEALGIRKDAVEHLELGQCGDDGRALGGRLAGDELYGASRGQHRAGRIAAGAPDVRQAFVQQAEPNAVPARIQARRSPIRGTRSRASTPDRERRLGGADLEVDPVRGRRPPGGGPVPRATPVPAATTPTPGRRARRLRRARRRRPRQPRSRRRGPRVDRGRRASATRRLTVGRPGSRPGRHGAWSARSATGRGRRPSRSTACRKSIVSIAVSTMNPSRAPPTRPAQGLRPGHAMPSGVRSRNAAPSGWSRPRTRPRPPRSVRRSAAVRRARSAAGSDGIPATGPSVGR